MENLLVILGPTASGKTQLSLQAAAELDGEIISGDSVQVYKGMDIGSAKLLECERIFANKTIPHYLIDIKNPDEDYTVAEFSQQARELISQISAKGKLPFLVGGTGFYLESVYGKHIFNDLPGRNKEFCDELKKLGNEELHLRLSQIDAVAAERIHKNDTVRLVRALDVYYNHGMTPSEVILQTESLPSNEYRLFKCGIEFPREELYSRIDTRVDIMMEQGLLNEVKTLLENGYNLTHKAMNSIGYKQIAEYFDGQYDLKTAIELIKKESRHLAKRQLTWFRRDKETHWYKTEEFSDMQSLYQQAITDMTDFFKIL